jgi:hypothetical protein
VGLFLNKNSLYFPSVLLPFFAFFFSFFFTFFSLFSVDLPTETRQGGMISRGAHAALSQSRGVWGGFARGENA